MKNKALGLMYFLLLNVLSLALVYFLAKPPYEIHWLLLLNSFYLWTFFDFRKGRTQFTQFHHLFTKKNLMIVAIHFALLFVAYIYFGRELAPLSISMILLSIFYSISTEKKEVLGS